MSLDYIREHYRVPAEVGRRVVCSGKPGTITKAINHYLGVTLDGQEGALPYHPTQEVQYGELVELPKKRSWRCLPPWRDESESDAWFTVEAETRAKARYAAYKYLIYDCECDIEPKAMLYITVRARR